MAANLANPVYWQGPSMRLTVFSRPLFLPRSGPRQISTESDGLVGQAFMGASYGNEFEDVSLKGVFSNFAN
jgi:hypothetical protein